MEYQHYREQQVKYSVLALLKINLSYQETLDPLMVSNYTQLWNVVLISIICTRFVITLIFLILFPLLYT